MKKILLIITAALFSFNVALSQMQGIRIGPKAGINFANLSYDESYDFLDSKMKVSYHFGIVAEFPVLDRFTIQPELLYADQGEKYEINVEGELMTMRTRLNYLNLPVLAKYYFTKGFSLEAGPQIGVVLYSKSVDEDGDKTDIEDINPLDFGLTAGLGYQFDVGLFVQGRYYRGLLNVNDSVTKDDFKFVNDICQLSVGYKF